MSSNWSSGGGSGGVESWNTRTGKVVPETGDYNSSQISGDLVTTFNGRDGAVVPEAGDYTAAMVTDAANLADTTVQTFSGPIHINGAIGLNGDVSTNANVEIGSNGTATGSFYVYDTTTFYNSVNLGPSASADNFSCGPLDVPTGGITVNGASSITGDFTIGTSTLSYNTTLYGKLTVYGEVAATGAFSGSTIATNGNVLTTITIPTSGTALPSVTVNTILYIVGGVITGITLDGDSLPTSLPIIYQRPGDTIVIDYTTAPTAIYAQSL